MHLINIVKDIADSLIKFWILISSYYARNIFNIFKCLNECNSTFLLMALIHSVRLTLMFWQSKDSIVMILSQEMKAEQ